MCVYRIKNPIEAKKDLHFLKERVFKLFNPLTSTAHTDHYMTTCERCDVNREYFHTGSTGLPCCLAIRS